MADALIGQPTHPIGPKKSSTNCFHVGRVDYTAQTAPSDSEIINQLLSRVTRGFDIPNSP